jgi:hypothetical protein
MSLYDPFGILQRFFKKKNLQTVVTTVYHVFFIFTNASS